MKKLISIILSLALVACMFGMSAMAAETGTVTNGKGQIGSYKGNAGDATINDGVEENAFDLTAFNKDVNLTLGDAKSRYAVDIVFNGTYEIEIDGLTWDVNKLTYVTTGTTVADQTYTFEVTNYSDKSVNVTTAASDVVSGVTATFGTITSGETGDTTNVAGDNKSCTIVGNAGGNYVANKATFSATLVPNSSWAETINALVGNNPAATSFKLATFTVTVSKDPVTP